MSDQQGRPGQGDSLVWSVVATLVAGPAVWGAIGYGVDKLTGTDRVFLGIGVIVGFVTSLYLVYVKYGRG